METHGIVKDDIAERKPQVMHLAKLLFQVNLAPAVLAAIFAGINLYSAILASQHTGDLGFATILIAALPCELFYLRQSRNEFLRGRIWGWVYSAVINIIWAIAFMASFMILGVLYSLLLLSANIYALYLIWQSGYDKERW